MLDPTARRQWLLTKALEIAPLREALAWARAAEDFLSGAAPRYANRTSSEVVQGTQPNPNGTQPRLLSAPAVNNDQPVELTLSLAGLSSLVTVDDVTQYLRQAGEVVAEGESADRLLARANPRRMEQGLPPFALLPTTPTKPTPKAKPERATAPRPLTARAREEYARSALALAAH
jgi:hypothetical protein